MENYDLLSMVFVLSSHSSSIFLVAFFGYLQEKLEKFVSGSNFDLGHGS